jgi:hypothetical protein
MSLTNEADGTTSLSGPVADQTEMHGLLATVRDLGVALICVETIEPPRGGGEAASAPRRGMGT